MVYTACYPLFNIENMDEQREKDIQMLCKQVIEECYLEPNWDRGTVSCPFCGATEYEHIADTMEKIKHHHECGYLIAKDLSTNGG